MSEKTPMPENRSRQPRLSSKPSQVLSERQTIIQKGEGKDAITGMQAGKTEKDTDKSVPIPPAGQAQAYVERMKRTRPKQTGLRTTLGEIYRDLEHSAGQGRRDGEISNRMAGHFVRQTVKTPRYVKNVGGTTVEAVRNIRYTSKLVNDVKTGVVSVKEARLAMLKRGGETLKGAGSKAMKRLGQETADFHGSDDLGIEAVRKPKDVAVNVYRTLRVTSRTVSGGVKAYKKRKQSAKKTVQAVRQTTQRLVATTRVMTKALSNPVILKSILVGGGVILAAVLLVAVVSGMTSVFASFTLSSTDEELTKTYAYMTELDADLNLKLYTIEDQIQYIGMDQFHYHLNGIPVAKTEMRVMTNTDYFLNYLDIKYKEYTLDGFISFLGGTVRAEIAAIHGELYTLTTDRWTEQIPRITVITDPLGIEHEFSWTETINHLNVSMVTVAIENYIEANKAEFFGQGQEEQYGALNEVGGMNLRLELGNPFPGYDWKENLSVTTRFGWRVHPISRQKAFHDGIDIGRTEGTPIQAVMGGVVDDVIISNDGYGNRVKVISGSRSNLYAHCKDIHVIRGQAVRRGDIIATVGNTGLSTDPHLHLEFTKDEILMNPTFFTAKD